MISSTETLVSVEWVMAKYDVATSTVYRWFGRGLESVKAGGTRRTSLEALDRFTAQSLDTHAGVLADLRSFGVNLEDKHGSHQAKTVPKLQETAPMESGQLSEVPRDPPRPDRKRRVRRGRASRRGVTAPSV